MGRGQMLSKYVTHRMSDEQSALYRESKQAKQKEVVLAGAEASLERAIQGGFSEETASDLSRDLNDGKEEHRETWKKECLGPWVEETTGQEGGGRQACPAAADVALAGRVSRGWIWDFILMVGPKELVHV